MIDYLDIDKTLWIGFDELAKNSKCTIVFAKQRRLIIEEPVEFFLSTILTNEIKYKKGNKVIQEELTLYIKNNPPSVIHLNMRTQKNLIIEQKKNIFNFKHSKDLKIKDVIYEFEYKKERNFPQMLESYYKKYLVETESNFYGVIMIDIINNNIESFIISKEKELCLEIFKKDITVDKENWLLLKLSEELTTNSTLVKKEKKQKV